MIIKAILLNGAEIRKPLINIDENNYLRVRQKLEDVQKEIIDLLKKYQRQGLINSIFRPKNKNMKEHLNELVEAKKMIKNSLKIIKSIYCK